MNNKKGKIVNRIINGLLVLGCLTLYDSNHCF